MKEILQFFDTVLKAGPALPQVTRSAVENGQIVVEVDGALPLKQATLQFTKGPHPDNKTRSWFARLLTIDGKTIRGEAPPADATAWYVTATDEQNTSVSTEVVLP